MFVGLTSFLARRRLRQAGFSPSSFSSVSPFLLRIGDSLYRLVAILFPEIGRRQAQIGFGEWNSWAACELGQSTCSHGAEFVLHTSLSLSLSLSPPCMYDMVVRGSSRYRTGTFRIPVYDTDINDDDDDGDVRNRGLVWKEVRDSVPGARMDGYVART